MAKDIKKAKETASQCASNVVLQLETDGYDLSIIEQRDMYNTVKSYIFGYLVLAKNARGVK